MASTSSPRKPYVPHDPQLLGARKLPRSEPAVFVLAQGFSFNSVLVRKFGWGHKNHVGLRFIPTSRTVVFDTDPGPGEPSAKLQRRRNASTGHRIVSASEFLRRFGINPLSIRGSYIPRAIRKQGKTMLAIDLPPE